jgi:hypothetical protein
MERASDLLICEIRRTPNDDAYEFELAPSSGKPETYAFTSPTELIDQYLRQQTALKAQGWRPRLSPDELC